MLQTDRRAETARQTRTPDREAAEQRRELETKSAAALALEAILSGGSWEQLGSEGVLALSHTVGNSVLADILALRDTGPERSFGPLPPGSIETEPMAVPGGEPLFAAAPDFAGMSPLGGLAPMEA